MLLGGVSAPLLAIFDQLSGEDSELGVTVPCAAPVLLPGSVGMSPRAAWSRGDRRDSRCPRQVCCWRHGWWCQTRICKDGHCIFVGWC